MGIWEAETCGRGHSLCGLDSQKLADHVADRANALGLKKNIVGPIADHQEEGGGGVKRDLEPGWLQSAHLID